MIKIPTSLYIHIPFCEKKCPYCDFNSHETSLTDLSIEKRYVKHLCLDIAQEAQLSPNRTLQSIFIGGGTPSLFSPESISIILQTVYQYFRISPHCEITMEANPHSSDYQKFMEFQQAGINRLSIGIQSTHDESLQQIGRLHSGQMALNALEKAQLIPFKSINVDLMYGLPLQNKSMALEDLYKVISLKPSHISWYHLTIERNTFFYKNPPINLPTDITLEQIENHGKELLQKNNYEQYEISAYAKAQHQSYHNKNYWLYGDYIAVGAGACGKVTTLNPFEVIRYQKKKNPKDYEKSFNRVNLAFVDAESRSQEFMMNIFRLFNHPFPKNLFEERTNLPFSSIKNTLLKLTQEGFLSDSFILTDYGQKFLDNMLLNF